MGLLRGPHFLFAVGCDRTLEYWCAFHWQRNLINAPQLIRSRKTAESLVPGQACFDSLWTVLIFKACLMPAAGAAVVEIEDDIGTLLPVWMSRGSKGISIVIAILGLQIDVSTRSCAAPVSNGMFHDIWWASHFP